jgi:hypothetical protein
MQRRLNNQCFSGHDRARKLLDAPAEDTLKGVRDAPALHPAQSRNAPRETLRPACPRHDTLPGVHIFRVNGKRDKLDLRTRQFSRQNRRTDKIKSGIA